MDETKALAQGLGVADRVEWLGPRNDVPQLMKAASILIMPTHTEGHSRSLLEAMALAKPVATTPVGGNIDMIAPNLTGLFFDVEDHDALADCVLCFASNPDAAGKMGRHAQRYVSESFNPDKQIENGLKFFKRIAHKKS